MNGVRHPQYPTLSGLLLVALSLLVIQYVLGMIVNLYTVIPFGQSSGTGMMGMMGPMSYMWGPGMGVLMGHMINGMLLAVVTLLIAVGALVTGRSALILTTWGGFASVIIAAIGGMGFLFSGGNNGYSLLMAFGFLGAVMGLLVALVMAWGPGTEGKAVPSRPLEILNARFARGELSREKYVRIKDDLYNSRENKTQIERGSSTLQGDEAPLEPPGAG